MAKIVVIGGGYAGVLATQRLAGKTKQDVTLINGSATFVERIRMHQRAANEPLPHHSIPALLAGTGAGFVEGWVNRIDLEKHLVVVETSSGTEHIAYDHLIYALGSTINHNGVPGAQEYAYRLVLQGDRSVTALRKMLPAAAAAGQHLVICGGGLTGIEAAAEFAEQYPDLRITLVTKGRLGAGLSDKGYAYLVKTFEHLGITLHEESAIEKIESDQVVLEDGEPITFDLCLWTGSFVVPKIAQEAGLAVNKKGQVLVDRFLRSISHPEVYAVGDSAVVDTVPLRMACATAMPLGAHAADNLAALLRGDAQKPFSFDYMLQCISLGRSRGLVQFVNADDSPTSRVITGRPAAWVKELICKFTVWSLRLERRFPGTYFWPGRNKHQSRENREQRQQYGNV